MTMTHLPERSLDAHGNPMTGDPTNVARLRPGGRPPGPLPSRRRRPRHGAGRRADEPAPMASALFAYLHLMSTDVDDVATAKECWSDALVDADLNEREHLHAMAVGAWVSGDWIGAARTLDELLYRWPTDVAGPDVRAPARLLPRRRPEPPRSGRALAARARSRAPARRVRARDGRLRAGGVGPLRAGARCRARAPSRPTPTTCGPSTPSPTPTRCRAWSTTASAS